MPDKFLQLGQNMLSGLLLKRQKPQQHALVDEESRYVA